MDLSEFIIYLGKIGVNKWLNGYYINYHAATYKGEIDLEIVIKLCNYSAEKMRSEVSFVLWSQHGPSMLSRLVTPCTTPSLHGGSLREGQGLLHMLMTIRCKIVEDSSTLGCIPI